MILSGQPILFREVPALQVSTQSRDSSAGADDQPRPPHAPSIGARSSPRVAAARAVCTTVRPRDHSDLTAPLTPGAPTVSRERDAGTSRCLPGPDAGRAVTTTAPICAIREHAPAAMMIVANRSPCVMEAGAQTRRYGGLMVGGVWRPARPNGLLWLRGACRLLPSRRRADEAWAEGSSSVIGFCYITGIAAACRPGSNHGNQIARTPAATRTIPTA
jgi:hypothetical protein